MQYAHFVGPNLRDVCGTPGQFVRQREHIARALLVAHARPRTVVEGLTRSRNSTVDIRHGGVGDLHVRFTGCRCDNIDQIAAG